MSASSTDRLAIDAGRDRGHLPAVLCALAPGALAGTQLAGLLFFLNPHWPFEPVPLLRAMGLYATLLGGASAVLLLPFTWSHPSRARRLLPWTLVVVFALAGLLHGVQASHYSYFLPAGINRRLIKAGLLLSVAAVLSFYTALVHTLRHRSYGLGTRFGFGLLALLSVYVVLERREAYDPPPEISPRASTVEAIRRPNLLVVGLGGGTLDVVLPLAEQGRLPFFASLLERGAYARLATIEPTVAAPLWMSVATGKLPYRHGVLAPQRFSAEFISADLDFRLLPVGLAFPQWGIPGGQLPPSRQSSRTAMTAWEICTTLGFDTTLVGWPAGQWSAGGLRAAYSEELLLGLEDRPEAEATEIAQLARERTLALEPAPFEEIDPALGADASESLFGDRWRQQLALDHITRANDSGDPAASTRPFAAFVYLPGLEPIARRTFGGFSGARFEGRSDPAYERAARLLEMYYREVDDLLHALWGTLPEPRLMVVVSAYGTRTHRGLERLLSSVWPQRRLLGRVDRAPDGLLMFGGNGVREGQFISRAELTDVVPTILYGLGFPVARDLDGRVLAEAFSEDFLRRQPLTFVPSYETILASYRRPRSEPGQNGVLPSR